MIEHYYPIRMLKPLVNNYSKKFHYLGTSDNCELVFTPSPDKHQYIIFRVYQNYFTIVWQDR